ncbi:MAG TPA: mRNA surveillance protein pelota [Candidatus Bathyarchaeia archaeon]|nr:MAG: mRNA surveillance protein pelota [Candidatus Bathyarchaeota archaeon RBG_16_48_13]HJX23181.1 mRNA surveillance protein pelota [Candidatus Bathyarchaeia archaeon]
MKIFERDLKHGKLVVLPANLDDLWTLYNVLDKGDIVYSRTSREIKASGDETSSSKPRRIPMVLGLRVEEVYFDQSVNRLRIHGIIVDCPEEFEIKGSHHTINVVPNENSLSITKDRWFSHQLKRIEVSAESHTPPVILVALDDEECGIAAIYERGIKMKAEIRAKLPGKMEDKGRDEARGTYYKSILEAISQAHNETRGPVIIVGPGFAKENLSRFAKDKMSELAAHIIALSGVSSSGLGGIKEAVRSGVLSTVLKKLRVNEEMTLIEELLARLASGRGLVSYGIEEVNEARCLGAIDQLLVADTYIRGKVGEERDSTERLLEDVERMKGKVHIISTEHEGGEKLLSLGGIAALLRFAIT